ncbi:MAG: signal peptidase I [Dehalococcoidia bacterium]|nr:signal peptidase I [Dehalococcoidia bacterium]|tara:strand:+ start:16570 stop:16971 length:402 start_codon:yes stop_codon:yes gene_type:complete
MNILKRVRFQKNLIIENSMNPSLLEGDEILLKKIFFKYVPNRFDIVKVNLGKLSYIKRVIGLPNENLKLNNNMVYINNNVLAEKYEFIKTEYSSLEISLGEQEIFLMGDNRIDSIDSRKLGPFKLHDVVGIFN